MPTVIDHAIAIPTRPHYVWDVIRDIPQNPTWQPNSQRVQFLTSVKQGRGTRWRNTTPDNREQVFEITAWYEGLGYEYRIVDGSPYPKNRGRIRLQEAPEGTVVQWTFSYEVDGFFGSIRNSIGMRGNADKQVVEGLRQLYGYIKDARNDEAYDPEASKAFLREAPNVVERSEYKPRYPSKISDQEIERADVAATQEQDALFRPPTPAIQTQTTPTPIIHEPPVEEGDTRPNPAVSPAAQIDAPPVQATPTTPFERLRQSRQTNLPPLEEPDFLKAIPDALPMDPIPADESASSVSEFTPPVSEPSVPATESTVPPIASESSAPIAEPSTPDIAPKPETETVIADAVPDETMTQPTPQVLPIEDEVDLTVTEPSKPDIAPPADTNDEVLTGTQPVADFQTTVEPSVDTSQMSIFDVFGVPRPSESQQVKTITPEQEAEIDEAPVEETADSDASAYEPLEPLTPKEQEEGRAAFMNSTPIIPDVQPRLPERRRGLRATLRRTMHVPDSD